MVSGGERIPKRKPDQTTVVRIELQDTERAMLESYLMTWQVGKAASAIDQLLSLENAYLAVTIFEVLTGKEVLPGTPNDIYKLIDWVREYFQENPLEIPDPVGEAGEATAGILGFIPGSNWFIDAFEVLDVTGIWGHLIRD